MINQGIQVIVILSTSFTVFNALKIYKYNKNILIAKLIMIVTNQN